MKTIGRQPRRPPTPKTPRNSFSVPRSTPESTPRRSALPRPARQTRRSIPTPSAPMIVIGGAVKGGLFGEMPSLEPAKLHRGDVAYTMDFRRVYASILHDWLKADDVKVLGKKFETLELFKVG